MEHISFDLTIPSSDAHPHDPPTASDPVSQLEREQVDPVDKEELGEPGEVEEEEDCHAHIYASDYQGIDAGIARNDRPEAIVKYLDLVCLHVTAILDLAAGKDTSSEIKEFMLDVNLDWMRHYCDEGDPNMMKLNDLLANIQKDDGEKLTDH